MSSDLLPRLSFRYHADPDAAARWLVEDLGSGAGTPFTRPTVLVPHQALQRHLTLALARATGVMASVRMVTPSGYLDEVLGLEGAAREWRTEAMTWAIASAMREQVATLPSVMAQLVADGDTAQLGLLARQIARRFRAYVLYRPGILESWESGALVTPDVDGHEAWQRGLWRALIGREGVRSPLAILRAIRDGTLSRPTALPEVLHVVSDPHLPPTMRGLLILLARWCDVRWGVLHHAPGAPSRLLSPRARAGLEELRAAGLVTESPSPVGPATVLERVQAVYRGAIAGEPGAIDGSLSLHRCHSAVRELETLREQIFDALASDPSLRPHDITLYVSSLETYLPSLDAVLGQREPGQSTLPFSVAGRPFRDRSSVAAGFFRLLELGDGRGSLRDLAATLQLAPIAAAAGFSVDDAAVAVRLLRGAGVHWGWDGTDRAARFDVPSIADGTWRIGIDRLVVGVATGRLELDIGGIVPSGGDTGAHASVIDRLVGWTDEIASTFALWRERRPVAEWPALLGGALQRFLRLADVDDARAARAIRESIERVCAAMARADASAACDLRVIREALTADLGEGAGASGHLRGGLRVCALERGAILPAEVVLIAGMSDELHPGGVGSLTWDLLQRSGRDDPAAGAEDPDGRDDALEAFRAAVCSARRRLHVTWTGVTMQRQEARAASVSVDELSSVAAAVLTPHARGMLLREEPAHPFSERLFARGAAGPAATPSSSAAWAVAARNLQRTDRGPRRFWEGPVLAGAPITSIRLEALAECVSDPTRYLCRRVLGLDFHEEGRLPVHEPLDAGVTSTAGVVDEQFRGMSYRLESAQRRGDVRTREELAAWMRAQPEMPLGRGGAVAADRIASGWWPIVGAMRDTEWLEPREVRCRIGDVEIVGRLDRLTTEGRIVHGFYERRPHSAIQDWVRHLVLCVVAGSLAVDAPRTRFEGPRPWLFPAIPDADELLRDLCRLYAEAQTQPIPLFRRTACALLEKRTVAAARAAAHDKWAGGSRPRAPGEQEEPWHRLCWPDRDLLEDDAFYEALEGRARAILAPMLSASVAAADTADAEDVG